MDKLLVRYCNFVTPVDLSKPNVTPTSESSTNSSCIVLPAVVLEINKVPVSPKYLLNEIQKTKEAKL